MRVCNHQQDRVHLQTMNDKISREAALERQLLRLERRSTALKQLSGRYAWLRLGIIIAGAVAGFFAMSAQNWLVFWIIAAITLVIFNIAAYFHRQVKRSIHQHNLWAQIKAAHIARMRLDWEYIPPNHPAAPPADHPFAVDLDLSGEHSIHRLLDTTVSQEGSARLLNWLLAQRPDAAVIARRQAQVRELISRTIFRDKLAMYGALAAGNRRERGQKWAAGALLRWLQDAPTAPPSNTPLLILVALSVLNITLAFLNALNILPALWQLTWIIYAIIFAIQWRTAGTTFEEGMALRDRIARLREVFAYLESYKHRADSQLVELCTPFQNAEHRPSAELRRLGTIIAAASIKGNLILWFVVNALIPWDIYFAGRLARAKITLAKHMPRWLEAWFDLEALCALASFAYLNPACTFPTIAKDDAVFTAREIGHPLIPDDERVSNDYAIDAIGRVTIITGSNMSGKSTFLRTLGVNLVLAYAGAPVLAAEMHTRLFRPFTCIRVSDSVTDGFSYFYAEVRRLKALLDALHADDPLPLFFLIDEIFRGTNNRERLIGSRAYIRALAGHHGVGLISTHDLELVKLADEIPQIRNQHFREEVHEGQMIFDYILHSGPSPTTNALRIMALAGLPVEDEETTQIS